MKRLIASIALAILCIFAISEAGIVQEMQQQVLARRKAAQSCSLTSVKSINHTSVGSMLADAYYAGFFYTPGSGVTLCGKIGFRLTANNAISGKTYTVRIWNTSGTSLTTQIVATSGVAGNNSWDADGGVDVEFTLASGVTLTGSTQYAVTVDQGGIDSTNYAKLGYTSTGYVDDSETTLAKWNQDKTQAEGYATLEPCVRLYR